MQGKQLVKKFALSSDELSRLTSEALGTQTLADLDTAISKTVVELAPNKIVKGRVIKVQEENTYVSDRSLGERPHDMLSEQPAIREIGERVVMGLMVEVFLERAQLRERLLQPVVLEQHTRVSGESLEEP